MPFRDQADLGLTPAVLYGIPTVKVFKTTLRDNLSDPSPTDTHFSVKLTEKVGSGRLYRLFKWVVDNTQLIP